jgi:hypothetical protein
MTLIQVRKQSRRISHHVRDSASQSQASGSSTPAKAGSINLNEIDSESETSEGDELRIPVVMVLFVLVAYTAIGGLLFRAWEGWAYFDAFYFCFITMATGSITSNSLFSKSFPTICSRLRGHRTDRAGLHVFHDGLYNLRFIAVSHFSI